MHRQELDRRHAQALHVLDHLARGEPRVLSLVRGNDVGMAPRVAAHVELVHDAFVGGVARAALAAPVERGIDDPRLRHRRGAIAAVEGEVLALAAEGIAELRVGDLRGTDDGARVRVEEQLVRIEAMARVRLVRAVHAIAVELARAHLRQTAVPDEVGALAQREAAHLALAGLVEEAQLELLGVLRVDREIHSLAVPGRAEGMRRAVPELPGCRVACGLVHSWSRDEPSMIIVMRAP